MSMRKLLESMARLDTVEQKSTVSDSVKPMSFLQSLSEYSEKNRTRLSLQDEYEDFKVDEAMNPAVATASMKMAAPKVSAVATPSAPAAPNAPKAPGVAPAKPGTPATNTAAPAVNAAQTDANAEAQAAAAEPDMQLGSDKAKEVLNTVAPIMQDPAGAQQLKTLADKFKLKPGVIK